MKIGVGYAQERDAFSSGKTVAESALERGAISRPDLVFAFCHGQLNPDLFLRGLQSVVGDRVVIIGGSAVGIITNEWLSYEGSPAGALIIESDTIRHRIAAVGSLDKDPNRAGRHLTEALSADEEDKLFMVFYDSIKIPPTEFAPPLLNASSPLLEGIEHNLPKTIPIVGAGLIGDYAFGPTRQFCGSYVGSQSVLGVLLSGAFSPYYRIMHGCTPLDGIYHQITKAEGANIYELDGRPIVNVIDELYGNQEWRNRNPVDLLTLGRDLGERFEIPQEANYINRLITGVLSDGEGIGIFEPDLEVGTEVQFMLRDTAKMVESARANSAELMEQVKADGKEPLFGMYIDCAGRAAAYLHTKIEEAVEVQEVFNDYKIPLFGFYSGVEIAPVKGKSRGLDWTGVLLIFAGNRRDG
jgi:small ligand-binding sensory domain FIST